MASDLIRSAARAASSKRAVEEEEDSSDDHESKRTTKRAKSSGTRSVSRCASRVEEIGRFLLKNKALVTADIFTVSERCAGCLLLSAEQIEHLRQSISTANRRDTAIAMQMIERQDALGAKIDALTSQLEAKIDALTSQAKDVNAELAAAVQRTNCGGGGELANILKLITNDVISSQSHLRFAKNLLPVPNLRNLHPRAPEEIACPSKPTCTFCRLMQCLGTAVSFMVDFPCTCAWRAARSTLSLYTFGPTVVLVVCRTIIVWSVPLCFRLRSMRGFRGWDRVGPRYEPCLLATSTRYLR